MSENYFTTLGMGIARALAQARDIADQALVDHLTPPPGAMDSALARPQAPRYDRAVDQEPTEISGSDCLQFVKLCMQRLTGSDRDEFCEGLAQLLSTETGAEDGGNGTLEIRHRANGVNGDRIVAANRQALDKRRNGARDNRRGPAMDGAIRALNSQSFARRFPDAATVKFGGNGR
jgi:hypothetical protein